jgi:ketol-acid reductoisomerase
VTQTASPRFYSELDADLHTLDGHRIAVVGYGALGRSVALNLRDAGQQVVVGNIDDDYKEQAIADGFQPLSIRDATAQADEVFVLLPDEVIPGCFTRDVAPRLRNGAAVCFASGYSLAYGLITPPEGADVLLIAPRMAGPQVRQRYLDKEGFITYVSVETDSTGTARDRMLALALAIGSLRRGAMELPAVQEALIDLLVEQTFGAYLGLSLQLAFRLGVEAGLPEEAMVLELYMSGEMAHTIDGFAKSGFFGALSEHGITALYGGFIRTLEVDSESMEKMFRTAIEDIRTGGFAKRFQHELADGYPTVVGIRQMIDGSDELSNAERRVRAALTRQ